MNIQAYIESGKLELFLLGELSDREREEVLALAKQHPEIQKELDEIEEAMLAFDQASAPIPSAGLKEKIMADLEKDFAPVKELKPTVAPEETGKVVKISPWKPFAVAASIVAVIASGLAIYFASKFYETEEQFLALVQEQEVLADNLNQVKLQYEETDSRLDRLVAGDFKRVEMKGEAFEMQKDAKVDVFWDQGQQEVFIAVNKLNSLGGEYDYQLWAIGPDGPVGIGLVNPGERFTLQQMQAVAEAGAFAITIEPKGGSQSPTLEKLVVLGEVA
ncbi:MAG TPA: anti-sigma factor [Algoriphagus sp.]|uniref:anti-sigma factor n=1 Tax=unclassified Algoriphagus TaxID=2641541 RepID=UPI000C58D1D4|nr:MULTISPECIES: anti-sigma factor [unclassified Algoriphagus]MAL13938.1 anti-sigma factor [Algoriphagus sp.]QYH37295.1 anti-sigma factor [Algoriphagus sp. NBT04N3]HAD51511.1 anti-sigma factor [Algoriphagus sp.]HAH38937.1 anti-sigma factor [Algoriphagus sp.]HAS60010.1 anti-sigma factor [Algoriphagus sp.]